MNDWYRSWHKAPDHKKWRTVAKRAGVPTHLVVSLVWTFLDLASRSIDRGSIADYDAESIADYLDCETDQVENVVRELHGKATLTDNRFTKWDHYQPKRERDDPNATERKQAERAKKRGENGSGGGGTENVTPDPAIVTPRHTTSHHVTPREEERREDTPSPSGDGRPTADEREPELAFLPNVEPSKPKLVAVNGDVLSLEPQDPEKHLFEMGKEVLLRGPNPVKKGGGLIASLLRSLNNDIPKAQECVDLAWGKQDPGEYLGACLKKAKTNPPARAAPHNPRLAASRRLGEYLDAQSR